ncbi:hypothetical protein Sfulv_18860 [Streptomyces fulvorobeus]|uniref:Uncharacterized protein n=1 Tax=Streptomyces fulvorobeus TaxID=284028 RepID=A0A7J0C3I4_9ACTN|nr:hypothetical protein Sfulv_18860 [Streptomyces fulvorobeus]
MLLLGVLLLGVLLLVADLAAVLLQRGERRGVDGVLHPGLGDGVVDGGLDALEVEDVVRLPETADLPGVSSRSCGSTPGRVRLSTETWSPPISSARNCIG